MIKPLTVELCLDTYGCRVIQRIFDVFFEWGLTSKIDFENVPHYPSEKRVTEVLLTLPSGKLFYKNSNE